MLTMSCEITSTESLIAKASEYESVLDVGCGVSLLLRYVKAKVRVGVDVCAKAVEVSRASVPGGEFICADLRNPEKIFQSPRRFECAVGMDILEHLEKEDALRLLDWCDMVASECHIWFVPTGYFPYYKDAYNLGNEEFMIHRSSWVADDLAVRGYEVWDYSDWHRDHQDLEPGSSIGAMWCLRTEGCRTGLVHKLRRYG